MLGRRGFRIDPDKRQPTLPEVEAARLGRTKLLFAEKLLVNPNGWKAARAVLSSIDKDDPHGQEALRGLWNPEGGEYGTVRLWPARYATHADGARILDLPSGPEGDITKSRAYEIELNLHDDGTIYLGWSSADSTAGDAIMANPSLGLVDGCLASRGRILAIKDGLIGFWDGSPGPDVGSKKSYERLHRWGDGRRLEWAKLLRRLRSKRYASVRNAMNGNPPPPEVLDAAEGLIGGIAELSPYSTPLPLMTIDPSGEMRFEWRGPGHYARIEMHIGGRVVGRAIHGNRSRWSVDQADHSKIDYGDLITVLGWFEKPYDGRDVSYLIRRGR